MENISKKEIRFRIDKIKDRVQHINSIIEKYNNEFKSKYDFAKNIGINIEEDSDNEVIDGLKKYINKANEILLKLNDTDDDNIKEEYKLLNNILYLDDIKLKNINELVYENRALKMKEYINKIAQRANQLIREEELKYIDDKIKELSKRASIIDKITGRIKNKKVLLENYNLKRVEVINKKYIPENKSILEIVNITKNCGYNSKDIDDFILNISNEYELGELIDNSLTVIDNRIKIPFFYNKQFFQKINSENVVMLDRINDKKKKINKICELKMYNDMLKNNVSTLELFNFNNVKDEVI